MSDALSAYAADVEKAHHELLVANARLTRENETLRSALDEIAAAAFGRQAGDEPNIYADYDECCRLSGVARAALAAKARST